MRIYIVVFGLIIILCNMAFADIIYFKNGGRVEGIIKERTDDHIVIDVGIGTVSCGIDEIDRIEEATPQELERLKKKQLDLEIERGEWAPSDYEDIRILYCKAKDDKNALQAARRKSQATKAEISQKEFRISELMNRLAKKGELLKRIDFKTDVRNYNDIVADMNSLNAELNNETKEVKTLYEKEKDMAKKSAELASMYRDSFQLFTDSLNKMYAAIDKKKLSSDELYFFEEMNSKMNQMEEDFSRDIAPCITEGGHVTIDALLDNSVSARLLVDTGASIVVISANVAYRLGIKYEDIPTEVEVIMADGGAAKAKPIILKSVKVGDAEVKDVQAAILESGAIGGVDGLLGMSFLSNFVIKVDSAKNELILERVL